MEKQTKLYKYISGWGRGVDMETQTPDGRTVTYLVLGEYTENGMVTDYISERIFENVLADIFKNAKDYEVKVQVGAVPLLVVINNGFIVMHNTETENHVKTLKGILEQIDAETIMDAYTELRLNMNGKSKLGAATDILMAKIEKLGNCKYSTIFVRAVINTMLDEKFFSVEDNELKEWMRSLDYVDLVKLSSTIMRFRMDGTINDDLLRELWQESGKEPQQFMKGVEVVLGQELTLRLIKGSVVNRQTLGR